MAVRGFFVPGLGHDELERDLLLAEVRGGRVAELVGVQAEVLLHEDAHAVVVEAGPSGVGGQMCSGPGSAGRDGFAVGEEEGPASADRPADPRGGSERPVATHS